MRASYGMSFVRSKHDLSSTFTMVKMHAILCHNWLCYNNTDRTDYDFYKWWHSLNISFFHQMFLTFWMPWKITPCHFVNRHITGLIKICYFSENFLFYRYTRALHERSHENYVILACYTNNRTPWWKSIRHHKTSASNIAWWEGGLGWRQRGLVVI